jgi:ATP-dependent helicase HrpB
MSELPIVSHLERIVDGLSASQSGFFILTGETGSGKSTHVPQALAARFSGKILMLEPRRVAALAIAMRVSELIGEEVGNTVGYRVAMTRRWESQRASKS